ncbi:triose-phosphate transporter family-domain-containing protein [Pelagophyceae sp. CCMP2097]|nr:triose-phosphate transporter family-domain-containing protein [Pelagophyceae sp. CCMP2097]
MQPTLSRIFGAVGRWALEVEADWAFVKQTDAGAMKLLLPSTMMLGVVCAFGLPAPQRTRSVQRSPSCKTAGRVVELGAVSNGAVASAPKQSKVSRAMSTSGGEESSMADTLKTGSFFALWYMFNIGYNIYNKKALNAMPLPWTIATIQMAVGIPYVFTLWATGLRKAPKLSAGNVKTLMPVAMGHLGTHIGAVISLGAGAVSFTHIVKASEPVVSAALSAVMLGAYYSPVTYATLLPIVGGVALASLKELSFTWLGFAAAMVSNVSSALRGILAKKTMGGGVGENMDEANIYAVLTIIAFIVLLPVSLAVEPPSVIRAAVDGALATGMSPKTLGVTTLMSGAYYYLYNEVAFLALGRVNPVTHAVGNTIKRVVIIIASVIAFKTPISGLGIVGSSIAILGTLLYSLAKQRFG